MFCVTSWSAKPKRAWTPTRMDDGSWVWLSVYQSINGGKIKRRYGATPQ